MPTADVFKVELPQKVVEGKRLGRHVHHDSRSRDYPADQAPRISSVRHNCSGLPLNQGTHDCATAHALCGALDAMPEASRRKLYCEANALQIYATARRLDTISEDGAPGSSGLMACKAAQRLGIIKSYRHAFGIDHALRALALQPVMTGVTWYDSFDEPDPETGMVEIAPGAAARGGHELLADQIDAENNRVWFWNSWGPDYGVGGRICMSFETWECLLEDRGDVTVPIP